MKILVVGLGLIGGSIAKDLRESGFSSTFYGFDNSKSNAQKALDLKIIDKIVDLKEGIKWADIILVAIPVDKEVEMIPMILDQIDSNTTVIDTGSAKTVLAQKVNSHPNRKNFVSTHPMAGTENSGPEAALNNLFKEKITIICDQELSSPQHLALAEKMFHAIGMNIAYMSSDEQDYSTAFVSHLPHAAAFALANVILEKEERALIFDLASGGFRSTVRLAKSSNSMWNPIFQHNNKYIAEALDFYIDHLQQFRDAIRDNDAKRIEKKIENANEIRNVLSGKVSQFIKSEEKNIKLYTK